MQHLINLSDLTATDIHALFDRAEALEKQRHPEPTLAGRHIANLFFEPSTRTRVSFELAAQSLGGSVVNLNMQNSSFTKGETLIDTYKTLQAMGIDAFVVRTAQPGLVQDLGKVVGRDVAVFNAGEGDAAHPTQGLLDALTIRQHKGDFENLSVAIVGDVSHSRVARSSLRALSALGCTDLRIVAPTAWQPPAQQMPQVVITDDLEQGIQGCDVVMALRIQNERLRNSEQLNREHYVEHFCLTAKRLESAKNNAIVMHPGPINRGIEITDEVADGPQSVILKQVRNGVAVRRALFDTVARHRNWYDS
ncbi:MAG: aspartate carbamoyltransferase catalytic subunit [Gammaproteobacteria bacterium]